GYAHLFVNGTLRKNFVSAVVTVAARDVVKYHHPVTDFEILDALADGGNLPRHLMPENPGRRMRPGSDLFQVGPADTAGVHANQYFPGVYFRHRNRLQAHIVLSAIHSGLHTGRNRRYGLNVSSGGGVHQFLDSRDPNVGAMGWCSASLSVTTVPELLKVVGRSDKFFLSHWERARVARLLFRARRNTPGHWCGRNAAQPANFPVLK